MKATAKYSDYIGTAAADFHSPEAVELGHYLVDKGVNIERYQPIGIRFFTGYEYGEHFHAYIICLDTKKSKDGEEVQVQIGVNLSAEDFFSIIKRIEVVLYKNHTEHAVATAREVQLDDLIKE